jgi:hypothetical protein
MDRIYPDASIAPIEYVSLELASQPHFPIVKYKKYQ